MVLLNPKNHLIKGKKNYEIVVLIDEGSASGSEILAAALKESGGYEVIGTNSFVRELSKHLFI